MIPLVEFCEDIEFVKEQLTESVLTESGAMSSPERKYYINGIFLQGESPNRNKRKYPKHILAPEVDRYRRQFINENRALGELGHPVGPGINLDKASHKIISLIESGNDYIGKAIVLDTPNGKIVKNLMDENVKLGVSSRGLGSVKSVGGLDEVQSDYFLATPADIVHDPSAYQAFVQALYESKEWVWNNGVIEEQEIASIKKVIESSRLNEEALMKAYSDFFEGISK